MAGTLLKTIKLFKIAVDKLELKLSLNDVERIGVMVDKAMSTESRSFHTAEHIFTLADADHPILLLAAIFHDIVYFTVDNGFIPEIEKILQNSVNVQGTEISIKKDITTTNPQIQDLLDVFDFHPGDMLPPAGGMNEFLSSLVLFHELKDVMKREDLLAVICCIELTIPFRGFDDQGRSPAERLTTRIEKLNTSNGLGLSKEKLLSIVQDAVIFANTDVLNFSSNEAGSFLDNTWKLLPETNPALRTTGIYTVKNYRIALQKIQGFMHVLDPGVIFLSYKGVPSELDIHYLNFRAKRNVLAAREYLSVKLLTIGILEAITRISGGDIPIALLMGDVTDQPSLKKFEDMLPNLKVNQEKHVEPTVYALLDRGRQSQTSFDLNRSPLSLFVYGYLGTEKLAEYLKPMAGLFNDSISGREFLDKFPTKFILPIIRACAALTFTRRRELLEYFNSRKKKK